MKPALSAQMPAAPSAGLVTASHTFRPAYTTRTKENRMNQPVSTFRALSSAFQHDAMGTDVDLYAAELAAQVGADPYPLLVGLIDKEAVRKFYGLVYLLDGYGLTLRQRHRAGGDGVFVYAERKADAPSEFDGAVVTETVTVTVPYAFPQAA